MTQHTIRTAILLSLLAIAPTLADDAAPPLAKGVRGLVTRAAGKVVIDGKLDEWADAFCTPVHYGHRMLDERAAQIYTMWDDEAFYVGLRALDSRQGNPGGPRDLWNGDSVEFYLDTRPGPELRGKDWSEGAIHFYFTPFEGNAVKPRWVMRSGIASSSTVLKGVEIAATSTKKGYELEFKLPWSNFPRFSPKIGALMAIDAELCSGEGRQRTDRTFAYGSPLSVQQPSSQGLLQLVKSFDPDYLPSVGAAAFPVWVDTPWNQPERGSVQATAAIPPIFAEVVGNVEFRIHDVDGKIVRTVPGRIQEFGPKGWGFLRATAAWSVDDHAPGTYFVTARFVARTGKALATVAPRMVSEANMTGR